MSLITLPTEALVHLIKIIITRNMRDIGSLVVTKQIWALSDKIWVDTIHENMHYAIISHNKSSTQPAIWTQLYNMMQPTTVRSDNAQYIIRADCCRNALNTTYNPIIIAMGVKLNNAFIHVGLNTMKFTMRDARWVPRELHRIVYDPYKQPTIRSEEVLNDDDMRRTFLRIARPLVTKVLPEFVDSLVFEI